tara:strand:+ start:714 stop:1289 length:576 start_codon:yes stop_codon:yes gene_type:complete
MSSVIISGDTSGAITVSAPAVAGTNTLTLQAGTATNSMNTLATAVASTSGTSIDFTSIPSWVKKITVMYSGISTSGTTDWGIRLGTSSGIESTGYLGATSNSSPSTINATTLAQVVYSLSAASVSHGSLTITSMGSNLWAISGSSGRSNTTNTDTCGYSKTTSGTLDRIRFTAVNGTDTFDAGSVNILYEG